MQIRLIRTCCEQHPALFEKLRKGEFQTMAEEILREAVQPTFVRAVLMDKDLYCGMSDMLVNMKEHMKNSRLLTANVVNVAVRDVLRNPDFSRELFGKDELSADQKRQVRGLFAGSAGTRG